MIVVRLMGGLGNQLFQYATGRALAARHGVELKLDVSAYDGDPARAYRLQHFGITAGIASPAEVEWVRRDWFRRRVPRLYSIVERRLPYYYRPIVRERAFGYDPNLFRIRRNAYLVGYWQDARHFTAIEDQLRHELVFKVSPADGDREILGQMAAFTSVSLHVRRGDYASNPRFKRSFGLCSPDYYAQALERIAQSVERPHFFVFSDDIDWARRHIEIEFPVSYMGHHGANEDFEDLRLMSQCKHHIIANSTFSWWGAWLSRFAGKTVIAPARWFAKPERQQDHPAPEGWIRL